MGKTGSGGGGLGGGTFTRKAIAGNVAAGDLILRKDTNKQNVSRKRKELESRVKKGGSLTERNVFDWDSNAGEVVRKNPDGTIRIRVRRGNEGLIPDLIPGRSKPTRSKTVKYIDVPASALKGATLRRARDNHEYQLI